MSLKAPEKYTKKEEPYKNQQLPDIINFAFFRVLKNQIENI